MTTGEQQFYLEVPEWALVERGVTMAEAAQLSMDCDVNPEAFDKIVAFGGKYIEAREDLQARMKVDKETSSQLATETQVFETLRTTYPPGSAQVGRAASKAAGVRLREIRVDHRETSAQLNSDQSAFSALLAQYCINHLEGAPLLINGQRFTYEEGFLQRTLPAKVIPIPVVYGTSDQLFAVRNRLFATCGPNNQKHVKAQLADDDDWASLFTGLDLMARY